MCVVYCHCIQFIILAHSLKIDVKPLYTSVFFQKIYMVYDLEFSTHGRSSWCYPPPTLNHRGIHPPPPNIYATAYIPFLS